MIQLAKAIFQNSYVRIKIFYKTYEFVPPDPLPPLSPRQTTSMCSLGLWFGLDSANGSPARDQRMGKKGRVIDSSALFPARAPEAGYAPHWRSPPSHQNSLFPGSTGASSCIPLRATNPGNCPAPCSPSTPSYTLRNTSFIVNHLL